MKDKILLILAWIFSALLLFIGFITLLSQFLPGLFFLAAGVGLLPLLKLAKKYRIGIVLVGLIVGLGLYSSTSFLENLVQPEINQQDYETFMSEIDTVNEIGEAGPLYFGSVAAIDSRTQKFEKARQKKVEEIQDLTDKSSEKLLELMDKVAVFRAKAWEYPYRLSAIMQDEELGKDTFSAIGAGMNYAGFTDTRMAYLQTLMLELDDHEADHFDREYEYLQFQKVIGLTEATSILQFELAHSHAHLAIYYTAFKDDADPAVKLLMEKMDKEINELSTEISTNLEQRNIDALSIQKGLAQLELADYAYLRETALEIKEQSPTLEKYIKEIDKRDDISDEDKEMIKDSLDVYKSLADMYLDALENVDTSNLEDLIAFESTYSWPPTANAGFLDSVSYLGGKIGSGLKTSGEIMWEGTKIAADAASKLVHGAKQGVGLAVDMSAAHLKTVMDAGTTMWYGNSVDDFLSTAKINYSEAWKSWKKGDSGSVVMKDTQLMLGSLDEGIGELTGGVMSVFTLGTDAFYLRTIAKGVGKITSGMFTGLGKGIAKLLDTKATLSEQASGVFDIVLTAIPLTKSFSKASDVIKGSKNYIASILNKVRKILVTAKHNKKTAGVVVKEAKGLIDNATKKSILRYSEKIYKGETAELAKQGKKIFFNQKGVVNTVKNNIDDSYQGLKTFVGETFESSLDDVGKAMLNVTGDTAEAFLDNVVGNALDELIVNKFLEKSKTAVTSFYDYLMGNKNEKVSKVESTHNPNATGNKPEAPVKTYTPPVYTPPAPVYTPPAPIYTPPEPVYIPPAPEPEPEPVVEPAVKKFPDGVSGGIVQHCESCWQVDMACSCGSSACKCCPNDATTEQCNAFDL